MEDTVGYGQPPKETQFSPGNNANPNGRPKGPITQFLRDFGDDHELQFTIIRTRDGQTSESSAKLSTNGTQTINQAIAARLLQMALGGDIKAIKEVLNRTEGRVPQPIKLGGDRDNPMGVLIMVPDSGRLDPLPSSIPPATEPDNIDPDLQ